MPGQLHQGAHVGPSHLADEDKGLPARPLGAPAKILHQLVDKVHAEGRGCGHVQLLDHLADLEGARAVRSGLCCDLGEQGAAREATAPTHQLVGDPADRGDLVCTQAQRDGAQVVIDVPGTVQLQQQDQLSAETVTRSLKVPPKSQTQKTDKHRLLVSALWSTGHSHVRTQQASPPRPLQPPIARKRAQRRNSRQTSSHRMPGAQSCGTLCPLSCGLFPEVHTLKTQSLSDSAEVVAPLGGGTCGR